MTHEELIREIMQLPLEQRMELLEALKRSLQEEMRPREQKASEVSRQRGGAAAEDRSKALTSVEERVSLSQRLYGILKFDGDPPTDEELKDIYADSLMEKYS